MVKIFVSKASGTFLRQVNVLGDVCPFTYRTTSVINKDPMYQGQVYVQWLVFV